MIASLKAEFNLCRKNRANFIIGACMLFIYCFLLLFSGVGGIQYAATTSIFGYVTVLMFLIPWFLSPASMFLNRKKICISSEHMALMLGISKRNFMRNRIVICLFHWLLMICVITVLQVPAWLIAGEQYSLSLFFAEVLSVIGFSGFAMAILFLCPGQKLTLGLPLWSGFCGGFSGGYIGSMAEDMPEFLDYSVLRFFVIMAVAGIIVFAVSVLYGYWKALREERRGCAKKQ